MWVVGVRSSVHGWYTGLFVYKWLEREHAAPTAAHFSMSPFLPSSFSAMLLGFWSVSSISKFIFL